MQRKRTVKIAVVAQIFGLVSISLVSAATLFTQDSSATNVAISKLDSMSTFVVNNFYGPRASEVRDLTIKSPKIDNFRVYSYELARDFKDEQLEANAVQTFKAPEGGRPRIACLSYKCVGYDNEGQTIPTEISDRCVITDSDVTCKGLEHTHSHSDIFFTVLVDVSKAKSDIASASVKLDGDTKLSDDTVTGSYSKYRTEFKKDLYISLGDNWLNNAADIRNISNPVRSKLVDVKFSMRCLNTIGGTKKAVLTFNPRTGNRRKRQVRLGCGDNGVAKDLLKFDHSLAYVDISREDGTRDVSCKREDLAGFLTLSFAGDQMNSATRSTHSVCLS